MNEKFDYLKTRWPKTKDFGFGIEWVLRAPRAHPNKKTLLTFTSDEILTGTDRDFWNKISCLHIYSNSLKVSVYHSTQVFSVHIVLNCWTGWSKKYWCFKQKFPINFFISNNFKFPHNYLFEIERNLTNHREKSLSLLHLIIITHTNFWTSDK